MIFTIFMFILIAAISLIYGYWIGLKNGISKGGIATWAIILKNPIKYMDIIQYYIVTGKIELDDKTRDWQKVLEGECTHKNH